MASLASINVKFTADLASFQSGMQKAKKSIEKTSKNMQKLGTLMSATITAPLTAIGIAAFKMAADLEDATGATDQIFKGASESVKDWANSLPAYYGIAKNEAHEYANMMGSMLKNIGGLTEEEASAQSAKLIELAGDLTAMYGGTTADAVRALTGALKGNNTMLDNYGMAANDAIVKAKAFEMGLISQGQEMSLAAKQAATLAVVYDQVGDAQGQAERESLGASGAMRALKTSISNLTTEFGEHLLPLFTPLINKINSFVEYFRELSPVTKKWIVIIAGIAAAIGPILMLAGTILPALLGGFTALLGPVGLVLAALAAIAYVVYRNWGTISTYIQNVRNRIIEAYNESKFFQEVVRGLILYFKSLYEVGLLVFSGISKIIKLMIENAITGFSNFGKIMDAVFTGKFKEIPGLINGWMKEGATNISTAMVGITKDVGQTVKNIANLFKTTAAPKIIPKIEEDETEKEIKVLGDIIEEKITDSVASGIKKGIKKAQDEGTFTGMQLAFMSLWAQANQPIPYYKPSDPKLQASQDETLTAWEERMIEFNEKMSGLVENFKETMFTGFAEGLGALISGQSNFGGILTSMLEMMADFVVQFGKLAIQTGVAALSLANVFANPFAAIAAGVALVALGSAMKGLFGGTFGSGAPRLANGGIVSGRTLVEVGEYANAPINPEVIAPLDKLQSMINSGGSIPELITLRAKGDELISVIRRTDLINSKA